MARYLTAGAAGLALAWALTASPAGRADEPPTVTQTVTRTVAARVQGKGVRWWSRRAVQAATPGPWSYEHNKRAEEAVIRAVGRRRALLDGRLLLNEDADAALIVAARNALPGLLARVAAAEAERDALRTAWRQFAAKYPAVGAALVRQHAVLAAPVPPAPDERET